jgi:hypothetical protein
LATVPLFTGDVIATLGPDVSTAIVGDGVNVGAVVTVGVGDDKATVGVGAIVNVGIGVFVGLGPGGVVTVLVSVAGPSLPEGSVAVT